MAQVFVDVADSETLPGARLTYAWFQKMQQNDEAGLTRVFQFVFPQITVNTLTYLALVSCQLYVPVWAKVLRINWTMATLAPGITISSKLRLASVTESNVQTLATYLEQEYLFTIGNVQAYRGQQVLAEVMAQCSTVGQGYLDGRSFGGTVANLSGRFEWD